VDCYAVYDAILRAEHRCEILATMWFIKTECELNFSFPHTLVTHWQYAMTVQTILPVWCQMPTGTCLLLYSVSLTHQVVLVQTVSFPVI